MALTLSYMYRMTPRNRKASARYVKITRLKKTVDKKGYPIAACQSYSTHTVLPSGRTVRSPNRNKYVTTITILDRKYNARLSCSCDDFMFTWEVALHNRGAAKIEFSNGEPPDSRNPSHRPGMCKHLVALYEQILPDLK